MSADIIVLCLFSGNQFKPMDDQFNSSSACWFVLLGITICLSIASTSSYALNRRVLYYLP
jgi:hypothetical protein